MSTQPVPETSALVDFVGDLFQDVRVGFLRGLTSDQITDTLHGVAMKIEAAKTEGMVCPLGFVELGANANALADLARARRFKAPETKIQTVEPESNR